MGACDVPVISDAVAEGSDTPASAPFDWLAQATGAVFGWLLEAIWLVFDTRPWPTSPVRDTRRSTTCCSGSPCSPC